MPQQLCNRKFCKSGYWVQPCWEKAKFITLQAIDIVTNISQQTATDAAKFCRSTAYKPSAANRRCTTAGCCLLWVILGQLRLGARYASLSSCIQDLITVSKGRRVSAWLCAFQQSMSVQSPGQQDTVCMTVLETDLIVLLQPDKTIC